jgi:Sugar (and other) transporter
MTFWQTFYSVGSFLAYWVRYSCSRHAGNLGQWDWRLVIIFQLLVPCLIVAQLPWLPDTPRWYASKGRVESARAALKRVRDEPHEIESELNAILDAIDREKIISQPGYSALYREPSVRKRLLLALGINAGQQCTGQGSLNSYSTLIYQRVFTGDTIDLVNALNATCGIIFTLNALWTADRYGRKPLFLVGAVGMAICMLIVASVGTFTPFYTTQAATELTSNKLTGTKARPVAYAITFLLFLFSLFYKPSWGATTWIFTSEIFPLGVRAQATGMASQSQNIAGSIVQQFFPTLLQKTGFACFYIFTGINLLLAVFVWFLVPETKGIELEDMDALFGGQPRVATESIYREEVGYDVPLADANKK